MEAKPAGVVEWNWAEPAGTSAGWKKDIDSGWIRDNTNIGAKWDNVDDEVDEAIGGLSARTMGEVVEGDWLDEMAALWESTSAFLRLLAYIISLDILSAR